MKSIADFGRERHGAALIYVSILMLAFVGVTGLMLDAGRMLTMREELQKAADAAALAGAWQLDSSLAGTQRADAAARTAPVVTNAQKFGASPGAITIATTRFFNTVPPSDDTALGAVATAPPYDYIEVTTTAANFGRWFSGVLGGAATPSLTATAVARKGQSICQVTPLFVCLPGGPNFDPATSIGRQVLAKAGGGGGWTDGNWGLLDVPGGGNIQNLPAISQMIAGTNGLPQCVNAAGVDTAPGAKDAVTTAFNVRFDMYENPHAAGYRGLHAPAENVTKAKSPNANCNNFSNTPRVSRLPRDTNINQSNRFGNGVWDCDAYWNAAHPGDTLNRPAACNSTGGMTRYEMYRHEIFGLPGKALIPNTTAASPAGDNGNPSCFNGPTIPPTPTATSQLVNDRRIFVVAGVDCQTYESILNGNGRGIPVQLFLSLFITEPAVTAGGQEKGDVYMEIVGFDQGGGGGLVPIQLREWVELVR